MNLTQVHIRVGKRRRSFSSMSEAIGFIQWRVVGEHIVRITAKAVFFLI